MTDKFCKDCRHFRVAAHTCSSPNRYESVERYDLVLGKRVVSEVRDVPLSCIALRALKDECGPNGKWFEKKTPPEPPNANWSRFVHSMRLWR